MTGSMRTQDRWVKILGTGGTLKATALSAKNVVREASQRHKLSGEHAVALGEALVAALLLASRQRSGGRISISVKGDQILKQVVADGTAEGSVRGFLTCRDTAAAAVENRGPWGQGLLSVVTLNPGKKEPYVGTIELTTGFLAKDLTVYLTQSEQIPSAVGLSVNVADNGEILSAGGFLLEVMPGAQDSDIAAIERNILEMETMASQLGRDPNPVLLLSQIFAEQPFTIMEEKGVNFLCTCSRNRVQRALTLLGPTELQDMIEKDHGASVHCDFCNDEYAFTEAELQALFA